MNIISSVCVQCHSMIHINSPCVYYVPYDVSHKSTNGYFQCLVRTVVHIHTICILIRDRVVASIIYAV